MGTTLQPNQILSVSMPQVPGSKEKANRDPSDDTFLKLIEQLKCSFAPNGKTLINNAVNSEGIIAVISPEKQSQTLENMQINQMEPQDKEGDNKELLNSNEGLAQLMAYLPFNDSEQKLASPIDNKEIKIQEMKVDSSIFTVIDKSKETQGQAVSYVKEEQVVPSKLFDITNNVEIAKLKVHNSNQSEIIEQVHDQITAMNGSIKVSSLTKNHENTLIAKATGDMLFQLRMNKTVGSDQVPPQVEIKGIDSKPEIEMVVQTVKNQGTGTIQETGIGQEAGISQGVVTSQEAVLSQEVITSQKAVNSQENVTRQETVTNQEVITSQEAVTNQKVIASQEVAKSQQAEISQKFDMGLKTDISLKADRSQQGDKSLNSDSNLVSDLKENTIQEPFREYDLSQNLKENPKEVQSQQQTEKAQHVFRQVLDYFSPDVHEGTKELTIKLKPVDLGELNIRIIHSKEGIMASINANDFEVENLMATHLPQLQDALREKGINVIDLNINFGQDSHQAGKQQEQGNFNQREKDNQIEFSIDCRDAGIKSFLTSSYYSDDTMTVNYFV